MSKRFFLTSLLAFLTVITAVLLFSHTAVLADTSACHGVPCGHDEICHPGVDTCDDYQGKKYSCQLHYNKDGTPDIPPGKTTQASTCQIDTVQNLFGKILPPNPLQGMLKKDPTGAGAISQFLSNGVNLIYMVAAIVLLFMILWGAFQWLTSGGDKEQLAAAQRRILNAIIGILLFAAAFAIISVLGTFTGFEFFDESVCKGCTIERWGDLYRISCPGQQAFALTHPPTNPSDCSPPVNWGY